MVEGNVSPIFTVRRARQIASEQLTQVRGGEIALNEAQAAILDAFDRLEFAQAQAARIRDAEVTAAGEGRVASNPRATSARAAAAIAPKIGTQRANVLTVIAESTNGLTDVEVGRRCRIGPNSARPRRLELVESGHVVDSMRTRRHRGRDHTVWSATAEGHAWVARNGSSTDDQAA
ncbi:hypothetical protein [Amycolatopsis sp. NBC_01480]|uniref:hypothetical protein n=1 Tax=Amycolatopsis sp. NBC_01480 TaxID=2903562 RepID=UPI002E27F36A|nr:hypothetical protein [Amycolatopsis sp. NBC_01480]